MERRDFLKLSALLAASGAAGGAKAMMPSEQAAYDRYNATKVPVPEGILASEPVLQSPAPDSMGVAFAINRMANGFAEVSESADLKDARRFMADGMPIAGVDDRVIQIRITGLKPATRYYYRVGAASLMHPIGYWSKPSETVWGKVHSFVTPGAAGSSRFGMMCDTHANFKQLAKITARYRALGIPLMVWNGDVPTSLTDTREDFVKLYLTVPHNEGYAADTPILLNRGNHDYRGYAARKLGEVMMPRPAGERTAEFAALDRNFALRVGEVALIGLDTGEDKPDHHPANGGFTSFTPYRRLQAKWLRAQFERTEIKSAPFVVACVHIPIYDPDPNANPGTILEDYAQWQQEAAELWGPTLTANGAQLVLAGHRHRYRFDPVIAGRSWAQIVGGGVGSGEGRFQTLVDCNVENGELVVRVWNTDADKIVAEHKFKRR